MNEFTLPRGRATRNTEFWRDRAEAAEARCADYAKALLETEQHYAAMSKVARDAEARCAELEQWLDNNTTFYNVDADWPVEVPNVPTLAQVAERIWYHATDDTTSCPFSAVVRAAIDAARKEK